MRYSTSRSIVELLKFLKSSEYSSSFFMSCAFSHSMQMTKGCSERWRMRPQVNWATKKAKDFFFPADLTSPWARWSMLLLSWHYAAVSIEGCLWNIIDIEKLQLQNRCQVCVPLSPSSAFPKAPPSVVQPRCRELLLDRTRWAPFLSSWVDL